VLRPILGLWRFTSVLGIVRRVLLFFDPNPP